MANSQRTRMHQTCLAGQDGALGHTLKARVIRQIRRRCQRHSQCLNHCGVSELFLAPPEDAHVIMTVHDSRLQCWLLGFRHVAAIVEPSRSRV